MKTAVLVIDVQRALCSGRWAAFDIEAVIGRINQVTARARAAGAPVVFIQHESPPHDLLAHGSDGWQLADGLQVQPGDHRVRKTASDSFHRTDLQALLQRLEVHSLVVCGLQSEYCVDSTVRRALALGYPVTLVEDGHSTMDSELLGAAQITRHHTLTLSRLDSFEVGVTVAKAAEVGFAEAPA